jgi:hypothetical protein
MFWEEMTTISAGVLNLPALIGVNSIIAYRLPIAALGTKRTF